MIVFAVAAMAAAFLFLHLSKSKPVLRNVALALFAFGLVLSISSVVRSINPAKRSQRIYLNMHDQRQEVQGEKLARLLAERTPPPKQVVYLLNRLDRFGPAHFKGLQRGAKEGLQVEACYAGTKDLDPTKNISGYTFRGRDVDQALREFPDADCLVFEIGPPPGTFALPEMRTRKPMWAVLSAPPDAPFDGWKEAGCVLAISDLPPQQRGSVIRQRIPGNLEKAFANEFVVSSQ